MTVEQYDVIDFVAKAPLTNAGILIISDHLAWTSPKEHLWQLQKKLNTYLRFIESGELREKYPGMLDPITIEIVMKYPPPEAERWFFTKAADASEAVGIKLSWRVFDF